MHSVLRQWAVLATVAILAACTAPQPPLPITAPADVKDAALARRPIDVPTPTSPATPHAPQRPVQRGPRVRGRRTGNHPPDRGRVRPQGPARPVSHQLGRRIPPMRLIRTTAAL